MNFVDDDSRSEVILPAAKSDSRSAAMIAGHCSAGDADLDDYRARGYTE